MRGTYSRANVIRFHSINVPMFWVDHRKYNQGVPDIGYNKFIFQLLMDFMRRYAAKRKFFIDLDYRDTKYPVEAMQKMLNFKMRNDLNIDHWPVRRLKFEKTKQAVMLQINDVLLGAIGLCANRKDITRPSDHHTVILAEYIRDAAGQTNLRRKGPDRDPRFTHWPSNSRTCQPRGTGRARWRSERGRLGLRDPSQPQPSKRRSCWAWLPDSLDPACRTSPFAQRRTALH
jgi:hypothetical protein